MSHFKRDLENPLHWRDFHSKKLNIPASQSIPPPPSIRTEELYWNMMGAARQNDPWMYPALLKLKANGWRLAAMSNTTIFPEGHEFDKPKENDVKELFDVFVSSAHVGMRKPYRDIYEYTLNECRKKWPEVELEMGDVLFLDDIGENLKMGRQLGMRTIRVWLGKTRDAVRELEEATGEMLLEEGEKARL
jgi:HAD superfamily hydrolase (TIGR01509 family)